MILGLIPARGGSKGVPGKNIRPLAGKPLVAYSIEAARNARCIDRVVVSTDDLPIAEIARTCGAEVPFIRPAELATDNAPMIPVAIHALRWVETELGSCEALLLLQPTSPFRPPFLVDEAIQMLREKGCDYVLSLAPAKKHPYWMKTIADGHVRPLFDVGEVSARRQDLPPAYAISGSLYAWTRKALLRREQGNCSGATQFPDEKLGAVVVHGIHTVDIDSELDFRFAEVIAREMHAVVKAP